MKALEAAKVIDPSMKGEGPYQVNCPVCNKNTLTIYDIGEGAAEFLCVNCNEKDVQEAVEAVASGKKPKSSGYEFVSLDELMQEQSSMDWSVRDWVPAEGLSLLFGDSQSGKTFQAIDWGLHVATGMAWHGKEVEQGSVFYIVGEGRVGLKWRIAAWCQWYGVKPENIPMHISKLPAQLYDEIGAVAVSTAIQSMRGVTGNPSLIIVDTLARNFGAGNENNTQDMNQFINHLDVFFCKPFEAMLMVVHHPGHGEKDRARGAYSLHCAMDAEYQITRDNDTTRLTCTKMKNFEPPEPMAFKTRKIEIEGEVDKYGAPRTSLIFEQTEYKAPAASMGLGKTQKRALDVLKDMHSIRRLNLEEHGRDPEGAKVEITEWRAQLEIEEVDGRPLLGSYPSKRWPKIRDSLMAKKAVSLNGCHVYIDF